MTRLRKIADTQCYHPAGSPMSLYDFHMYLKYIEFSAENLEFYIWYVELINPAGLSLPGRARL